MFLLPQENGSSNHHIDDLFDILIKSGGKKKNIVKYILKMIIRYIYTARTFS